MKALNLAGSGIELKQLIIRLPPAMEMAGLRVLQLVFNPMGFKLLDSISNPIRVLGNPFLMVSVGVFLQGIPKFIPCHQLHQSPIIKIIFRFFRGGIVGILCDNRYILNRNIQKICRNAALGFYKRIIRLFWVGNPSE